MRKLFRASISKVYIAYLLLLTTFVIGTYSSYAYFTVNKEKKNAIKMVTGNLIGELKVDDVVSDKLVVNASETKTFKVELYNKNNRKARFNFYYKGSLPNNVEAGYVMEDGMNNMPKETGVNLTSNGTLGYFVRFQIKVVNNTSSSVTIPLGYEVGLDYNDLFLPNNCYLFEEAKIETKPAVETLLAEFTNPESTQDYNSNYNKQDKTAKENKMYVFNHTAGTQQSGWTPDELKSYRYIGADPNNYILFNEEMWRIIGIETVDDGTGKKEKRIKLIRDEPLNSLSNPTFISWDNKPSGTGSSNSNYGSSWWGDSRLMMVLNPGYETDSLLISGTKGSLYWNRQSGKCPKGSSNGTIDCNFTSTGLTSTAQGMIGDTKWYLGGLNWEEASVSEIYQKERGETAYGVNAIANTTRGISWTGKVGLMYPSDYGYATSGGSNMNRNICMTTANYDDYEVYGPYSWVIDEITDDCIRGDWLYKQEYYDEGYYEWFIAPFSVDSDYVVNLYSDGSLNYSGSYVNSLFARPVVYLTSDVKYQQGDGSQSNPFVFTK